MADPARDVDMTAIHQQMTLTDWLDDLTVRFLLNLPPAELSSVPRLCFQVEEAQWYYEDFIRPLNPSLPSLNLRAFLLTLFQHCPLLSGFQTEQHVRAYEEFLEYKTRVPVRGAILMNDNMDKVLLVKGWKKGASWSFPRGKINKDEDDLDCAVREVYEETGFDATSLVDENRQKDGRVKSIDVTMKEQHMKLFVFRGVSMDTHFEPRTRKEISGIQWYNVKDLPGFKKQKGGVAGVGHGEAQATKFYMVAPFLGQLKKWIGQQRRTEGASAQAQHGRSRSATNNALQAGITEDEAETEPEFATDNGLPTVDMSSQELKKLLSIGGPSAAHAPPSAPQQEPEHAAYSNAQTNNLLAMLQGSHPSMPISGSLPHTPLEQIDPSIPQREPATPQPHHPREPSFPQMPHFAYSPQRLQEQQRNYSVPNQAFHQPPQHQQQQDISHLPLHVQQMMFPLQQRQGSMPNYFPHKAQRTPQFEPMQPSMRQQQSQYNQGYGPNVGDAWNNNRANQTFRADDRPTRMQRPHLASPMHSFAGQRPQSSGKPIGSDPLMPEASKLPQPNLPAHTQLLLDAFKHGRKPQQVGSSGPGSNQQRHNSQQASALLDLFLRPGEQSSPLPATEDVPAAPASPAVSDVTVKPKKSETKATLNEITRTLPARSKTKSPKHVRPLPGADPQVKSPDEVEVPTEPSMLASIPHDVAVERPKSRGNLYDPAKPKQFVRASPQPRKREPPKASPKAKAKHNVPTPSYSAQPATVTLPTPQFSILQRPSSSRSPVPQSPLRNESAGTSLQPQVLRRPGDGLAAELAGAETPPPVPSEGKKNHLLSLFNKPLAAQVPASISSPPSQGSAPPPVQPQSNDAKQDQLLGLFNSKITSSVPPVKTPELPPTPQLQPDARPSHPQQGHRTKFGQQQLLLSMFSSRPGSASSLHSPGTPVSPFTLGTPLAKEPPAKLTVLEPRSRLGSMHSVTSNGTTSGQQTSGSATPTEASKGILLSYLNGVVEKEGYWGAKR